MKYPHLQKYRSQHRTGMVRTGQNGPNGYGGNASMPGYGSPWSGCNPDYSRLDACNPYGPNPGCRVFVLPFDSGDAIPAFTSNVQIQTSPQTPFVGKRLVVPSDFSDSFIIEDVKVGKDSQFSASGAVAATVFSEVGVGVALEIDCAYPGIQITLEVSNIGPDDQRFLAAFIGNAVEL